MVNLSALIRAKSQLDYHPSAPFVPTPRSSAAGHHHLAFENLALRQQRRRHLRSGMCADSDRWSCVLCCVCGQLHSSRSAHGGGGLRCLRRIEVLSMSPRMSIECMRERNWAMRWLRFDMQGEPPATSYRVWSAIALVGTIAGMWVAVQAMRTVPAADAALQGVLTAVLLTAVGTGLAVVARAAANRIRKH